MEPGKGVYVFGLFMKSQQSLSLWHAISRSLLQSELLLPWQQTLFDLLAQLGDSNPETSTLVVESITLSAMHREASCLQGLQENINSVLGKALATGTFSFLVQMGTLLIQPCPF